MTSSKDRQFLARFHRAKSSFAGSWSCRSGEDYISPSPRGRGQKKREKASKNREYEEIKASQQLRVQSDRLSLEGLALEFPREEYSKRTEKGSPTPRDTTNGQPQRTSQRHQDDFDPRGENVGDFERDAASAHVGLPKSGKGKEKADTDLDTSHFERDHLQDVRHEIEEVMDENEPSSSMHHAPEEDSRPTDPLKSGSSKPTDFRQNTKAVNTGSQGGFEDLRLKDRQQDCRPADFQRAFSSNPETEEVDVSNSLNKDSETLREEEDREAKEENRLHHSVDGVTEEKVLPGIERSESPRDTASKESSVTGKAGQNLVIPNSGSSYNLQEAEGEKVKASEYHESPVSVLSSALGSGRWADFDSANNTPYPHADSRHEIEGLNSPVRDSQMVFSKFSDVAIPGNEIRTRQPDSDNLQQTEDESLESSEVKDSHHLQQDFPTGNSHATGKDAIEEMGSVSGDYPAVFSEKGQAENKIEPNHPLHDTQGKESDSVAFKPERSESLEQASKDGTEHSSQNLTEKSLQDEIDPMVQNRKQKLDWNPDDGTGPSDGREGPSPDRGREAQNSDNLQKIEGEKMQDGLHGKQTQDISPKTEVLGELLTGDGSSNTAANGDHHNGTRDPNRGVTGSTKLNGITAAGKDEGASIYRAGPYLGYFVVGVAVVIGVSYLHYRRILW